MPRKKLFQRERLSDYSYLITYEQPMSYHAEAFQKALVNLEYVNVDGNLKAIQFTSSLAGAGKSTFVSNMAHLMGKKGKKVVILDLDLRKPKLNRVFKVANENGITDYLSGKISFENLVRYDEKFKVHYILAGEKTTAVVNVLEAQKLKDLIAKLKETFDYVLLDSPPVLAVSDPLYIARLADGVIFIVAQDEAKKSVINEAISTLKQNHVNVIGSVFTQVNIKEGELYAYTYGDGYGYNSSKIEE